ncbi:MAG: hypothetical protein RLZZ22_155, partial [Pseudomonadota bacterium]
MHIWKRWSVSGRLYFAFALTGALLLGLAGLSFVQQHRNDAVLAQVTEQEYKRMLNINAWQVIATGTTVRITALNRSQDPALGQLFGPEIGPRIEVINKHLEDVRAWATAPDERAILQGIDATTPRIMKALGQIDEARKAGDAAAALAAFEQGFMPAVTEYHAGIDKMAALQQKKLSETVAASQAQQWRQYWAGIGVMGLIAAGVGLLVASLVRYIRSSLARAIHVAEAIQGGQLGVQVDGQAQDEFGNLMRAMDGMAAGLREVVSQVRQSTDQISGASEEIARGNLDLSERTERQASHLQQTAATMEELASTVRQSASNAGEANQLASQARDIAERGGEVVARVVNTMGEIEKSSQRIGEIISVIDGISFQTNILALNAAVEAARAGEQGRGFAVVAGEVRNLAQRSASAAKEIKTLINDSAEKVRNGSEQVETAGKTMSELVRSVQQVSTLIGEISTAAAEQRAGIQGVSEAVNQLDESTQQNASLVEQAAAAAG